MTTETLSWDTAIALHAESALRGEGQGYNFRRHADATCTNRLNAASELTFRKVVSTSAAELCSKCTTNVVESSVSTVIVAMRSLAFSLGRRAESTRYPRAVAVAAGQAINELTSVHPEFELARTQVLSEVKRVENALPLY